MPIFAYIRVSTVEQADSQLGLLAQQSACTAYATRRLNCSSPNILLEVRSAHSLARRPVLTSFLTDANGATDLIVLRLDRLARNALDLLSICQTLSHRGIALHSVRESLDTATPSGRLFITMLAGFSEFERDMISLRTREALAQARKLGRHIGRPPFAALPGVADFDLTQLQTVRNIHLLRRSGASLRAIARLVHLKLSTVRYVLRNPIYKKRGLL